MADRRAVLANMSALMMYRWGWTSADGRHMEVQWAPGTGNPLIFRGEAVREIACPERFGWKTPKNGTDFKKFVQAVADEWEAGYDDDELEELQAVNETPMSICQTGTIADG